MADTRAAAERIERAGKKVVRVSVAGAAARRLLRRGQPDRARRRAEDVFLRRSSPASVRCAACTMRRMRPAPSQPAPHSASISPQFRKVWSAFPDSHTACSRSGAKARPVTSTTRKRPMPIPPRRRSGASTIFSGSPVESRRPAVSSSLAEFFPRIRKAYLIGEAAEDFAQTLDGKVPHVRSPA